MEIMQTIGTILFGLTGLGFLLLAILDRPLGARNEENAGPTIESRPGIFVPVRLLRSMLAKLQFAAAGNHRLAEAAQSGRSPGRSSPDIEKVA